MAINIRSLRIIEVSNLYKHFIHTSLAIVYARPHFDKQIHKHGRLGLGLTLSMRKLLDVTSAFLSVSVNDSHTRCHHHHSPHRAVGRIRPCTRRCKQR